MNNHAASAIWLIRHSLMLLFALALFWTLQSNPLYAQILKRGVQGGVVGAVIGGIVDGGSGIGKGAAIGAGVGAVAGAIEADQKARRRAYSYSAPPPGLVYDTQVALTRLGYRPGPIDGIYGPGTAEAIRQYQYANRLPVTGRPSPRLLDHMRYGG